MSWRRKLLIIVSIPLGLILLLVIFLAILFLPSLNRSEPITFGVTFSETYAESLGLDWRQTYLAILDDLKVRNLRLIAYWNKIEPTENYYDFADLDWQINQAEQRGDKIILTFGERVPRWPECWYPNWVNANDQRQTQTKALELIRAIVSHYKNSASIEMWQVENEPLFPLFGRCPWPDKNFLAKEIELVRSLDQRPIIVTDSGELSLWFGTARLVDYFGTTMYRVTYNPWIGYFYYDDVLAPAFYRTKAWLVGRSPAKVLITELQAESWSPKESITKLNPSERQKSFDVDRLQKNLDFASRTGFSRAYLWGVEYWYWLKTQGGDDSLWQAGQKIWQKN